MMVEMSVERVVVVVSVVAVQEDSSVTQRVHSTHSAQRIISYQSPLEWAGSPSLTLAQSCTN